MLMKVRIFVIGLLVLAGVSSCGDFNKIVKSTDYEFKHKKAIEFFEQGDYVKAGTLFQELVKLSFRIVVFTVRQSCERTNANDITI